MESYGLTLLGPFKGELVATLPAYDASYEGREIYTQDTNKRYYADDTKWIDYTTQLSDVDVATLTDGSIADALHSHGISVLAKISDHVVTTSELVGNVIFTNLLAGVEVNFTLPAATVGMTANFEARAAQYLRCTANGTETFEYYGEASAAGGYMRSNVVGASWMLQCREAGKWSVLNIVGIINYDE